MTLEQLTNWTNLAIAFLLLQVFVVGIAGLISLFYGIRAIYQFDRELRTRLPSARRQANQVAASAEAVSRSLREPLVSAASRAAQVQRILSSITASLTGK